jgi:hypothetical protein
MTIEERISCFDILGGYLKEYIGSHCDHSEQNPEGEGHFGDLDRAINLAGIENPWFTREFVITALKNLSESISRSNTEQFLEPYKQRLSGQIKAKTIGVVMAGNIPLVGFHDFFCTLMAGHRFLGKSSSEDKRLLPAIAGLLIRINPGFRNMITFTEEKLKDADAIIATGSNNTFRYFEYYFGKYPHILRKNRNGVAVITGNETKNELSCLADDIFTYFGKGCRNISKLYLPKENDFDLLLESFAKYAHLKDHHKYVNNYNYYKTIFLVDRIPFHDAGNILLTESMVIASPVSVLHYEYYDNFSDLQTVLTHLEDQIQCKVCHEDRFLSSIKPGNAQSPALRDYADGVDTMDFLLNL